ncbi:hypothetical protein HGE1_05647 [Anaplasma phagocytophilum str. HGE1]|uniref:Conserved domain protein n=1 Tax=Anaplasma phagocytophilum (strain HZ) TaxID=212042 RepID=Q2GIJ3_ANAPZ|nr:conserved domain protein [Anaplasma phagocytophilum str. HZ]AGR79727.1 hypothetical protein YYU_05985 [Anaplasma phagocytophilum str. HZ2]AGR80988.1 hypothetical protein WSQ_06055 [Anaplasma phagocytophilum str. JM]AGR82243.1 hypothetical protein YYY_06060 [Anaplasma phagocytophilum str. Dog2]EOA61505.1 hypothetical protein HGE1_05647 [Anaplasma phagocytophilum str. HGE1]KDB55274.1 hypothetical protein O997_06080 [Anaplasma phagocytophilum str. MRK]
MGCCTKKPSGSLSLIDSGTICTLSSADLNDKLSYIFSTLTDIIQKFSISVASNVFVNLNPRPLCSFVMLGLFLSLF